MNTAQRNRIIVASSLFALLIASSFIFGPMVFLIGIAAIATSFVIEILNSVLRKEKFDWTTFLITPLIITLLTSPTFIDNVWMVMVATGFGVFFAKSIWGGEGKNVFNPAIVGLIFVTLAFPAFVLNFLDPINAVETITTPAVTFKSSPASVVAQYSLWDLLLGNYAGGIGTTFKLGILIIGSLFMILKISDWKIPLTYLGMYFVLSVINYLFKGIAFDQALLYGVYALLMGHLFFGALLVATDPQTSPLYSKGKIIYGLALGFVTWIIQNIWLFNETAPNTEGMIYAVLFMNAVVGLIDVWTVPKVKTVPLVEEV